MPSGKSREILDQRGERKLAARFVSGDDQRFQIGARGVDGGGVSGAAGADDDHVMHGSFMLANFMLPDDAANDDQMRRSR